MKRRAAVAYLVLTIANTATVLSAAQEAPSVETFANGRHVLRLTKAQQAAVDAFVRSQPDFLPANCDTLNLPVDYCAQSYREWADIAGRAKAQLQYPYVAWRDLNGDGLLDFVVPFFSRTAVNNWGWRNWQIVVFEGRPDGSFKPVVAARDTWAACFDGMLYEPTRKRMEYWCGSGGGSFRWNGSRYVMRPLKGD